MGGNPRDQIGRFANVWAAFESHTFPSFWPKLGDLLTFGLLLRDRFLGFGPELDIFGSRVHYFRAQVKQLWAILSYPINGMIGGRVNFYPITLLIY